MAEKTAVQTLIKSIENQIELSAHNKLGTNRTGDYRIGLQSALGFCFDELETEKKQIIDAYMGGIDGWITSTKEEYKNGAEQYYNETYKQE